MLRMAQIDYIKHLRDLEGASIEEIRRTLGIDWRTAKKYADSDISPEPRKVRRRKRPVSGPIEQTIDAWIEENELIPRKQRMTAHRMYERLKEEVGFTGAESTVRRCVRLRREALKLRKNDQESGYVRLEHTPGTAQVDFGQFDAIDGLAGGLKRQHCLVMSFPYSNASFCWVTPAENGECLLHGLSRLFTMIGGVPQEIWFDNTSAIVTRIEKGGDRKLTELFKAFRWYYRFKAVFCNRNAGHEKGSVESKVGYSRRNFLTPVPVISDVESFSENLAQQMLADMDRKHYRKGDLISDLWMEEKKHLLRLPEKSFEVCTTDTATVNRYSEVQLRGETYHIAQAATGTMVFCKVYWDKIEIFDRYGEKMIARCIRPYSGESREIDWRAELAIFKNKPRAIERASYLKALPETVRGYLLSADLRQRSERVKTILSLLDDYSMPQIEKVIESAALYGRYDLGSLRALASHQQLEETSGRMKDIWTPEAMRYTEQDLTEYDMLAEAGVGV